MPGHLSAIAERLCGRALLPTPLRAGLRFLFRERVAQRINAVERVRVFADQAAA